MAADSVEGRTSQGRVGGLTPIRGLVLGKFLPPHAGHLHLIRTAARHCDELTVLVCTLEREPIPGALRARWMRELAAGIGPHIRAIHVADDVPQAPEEHRDFWAIWTELCTRYAGPVDVVFTSESYGDRLAEVLGARHYLVDLMRQHVPISGTAIREDAFASWEMIPAPVRAHYAVRVALVGPESTGKTTLAARLAAAFGTLWVPEYGREHTAAIAIREGMPFQHAFTIDDIAAIATTQAQREDRAARHANKVLFCDTELLTTRVWSEIFFDRSPAPLVAASEARTHDLYLLLDTDVPWIDDGTRAFRDQRQEHFERLRAALDHHRRPYEVVSGPFEDRFARAAEIVCARWPALTRIDDV